MLDKKGFDLWADGYDKTVGISDEENRYPFAGYKKVLNSIFQTIMQRPNATVLDLKDYFDKKTGIDIYKLIGVL